MTSNADQSTAMCSYIINRCSWTSTCTGCRRCKKDEARQSGDGAMEEAFSAVRNSSLLFWSFAKNLLFVFLFHPRLLDNKLSLRVYARQRRNCLISFSPYQCKVSFLLSLYSLPLLSPPSLPSHPISLSFLLGIKQ